MVTGYKFAEILTGFKKREKKGIWRIYFKMFERKSAFGIVVCDKALSGAAFHPLSAAQLPGIPAWPGHPTQYDTVSLALSKSKCI